MKFGRSVLSPSYVRKPHFKSNEAAERDFHFACLNCDQEIVVEFNNLIGAATDREDRFPAEFIKAAEEFYGIGLAGKSPDGGFPVFYGVTCGNCKTNYLLYAGVDEPYNSIYLVTIQAITELLESEETS